MAVIAVVEEMAADLAEGSSEDGPPKQTEDAKPEDQVTPDVINIPTSSAAPREELISTAVHFLQNPRVQKSPVSQKRAFLLKKGLTQTEVELALNRVAGPNIMPQVAVAATSVVPARPPNHGLPDPQGLVPWHPGSQVLVSPPSLWQKWRDLCSSAVVIGATCYGAYYLYKEYLEPALIGQKRIEEDRLDRVERHLLELNKSLSQLRNTLVSVESTLAKQSSGSDTEQKNDSDVQDIISLAEIKSEMASIKALLLSRKQFPATPQLSANIPVWQLKQQPEESVLVSSLEDTAPKQIAEDTREEVHTVSNGLAVNGTCEEGN